MSALFPSVGIGRMSKLKPLTLSIDQPMSDKADIQPGVSKRATCHLYLTIKTDEFAALDRIYCCNDQGIMGICIANIAAIGARSESL